MVVHSDKARVGGYIVSDSGIETGMRSREQVTLAEGGEYVPGQVLSHAETGSATVKLGAMTGNGAVTLNANPVRAGAQPGNYSVKLITAAANGGTFRVTAPDGDVLGDVAVGQAFANQVAFSVADGSTDFVVGDAFTIEVDPGAAVYGPHDPAADDGREVPSAICYGHYDATDGNVRGVITARASEVNGHELVWDDGMDAAAIAKGVKALGKQGIIVRY